MIRLLVDELQQTCPKIQVEDLPARTNLSTKPPLFRPSSDVSGDVVDDIAIVCGDSNLFLAL
jgi:hypothetical protein